MHITIIIKENNVMTLRSYQLEREDYWEGMEGEKKWRK